MKNITLTNYTNTNIYIPPTNRSTYDGLLLDANERQGKPSKNVIRAMTRFLTSGAILRYPEYGALERSVARYAGAPDGSILLTNGSDQAISMVFRAFTDPGDTVIIPSPTFSMYEVNAVLCKNIVQKPAYQGSPLAYPIDAVISMITPKTRLVVICNPNNPTGTSTPISDIKTIAQKAKNAIVLVDEAYAEFSGLSCIDLIETYPNIVILRTFSKAFGLAGARIGYIIANPEYIQELAKLRGPYDVNSFAVAAAAAALRDIPDMKRYVRSVMTRSKLMLETFFSTNGIRYAPSQANFLLIYPENASRVDTILRANAIRVRRYTSPELKDALRITIGTVKQTQRFISVYTRFVLSTMSQKPYAFIDRDGTMIYEPPDTFQVNSVSELQILPGVISGLKQLQNNGYRLVMVTNQDGLGSASNPKKIFTQVQKALLSRLQKCGITLEKIYICPHLPEDGCACRKPKTGLIKTMKNQIDRNTSFMCGDRASDKGFAKNLGISYKPMKTNGNFLEALNLRKENV